MASTALRQARAYQRHMSFTREQADRHNHLYNEALKLIAGEIHLDGREMPKPGWLASRKLRKAKSLFEKTIEINPSGWQAMLAIAKIEQRFAHMQEALKWLLKAREFDLENIGLAKEASLVASRLGLLDMAARIAGEAIEIHPTDPALKVNAGVAHLLAGDCEIAVGYFREATRLEPAREANRRLLEYAMNVASGVWPLPETEADILKMLDK